MSALGQKQTFGPFIAMSALPPKADIDGRCLNVCFVPKADVSNRNKELSLFEARPTLVMEGLS
jgi:hypothetical protein